MSKTDDCVNVKFLFRKLIKLEEVGGNWWTLVEIGGNWWKLVEIGGHWWKLVEIGTNNKNNMKL